MKIKTLLAVIVALLVTNVMSYFIGSHSFYMASDIKEDGTETIMYPHWYNTEGALNFERSYANALMEGLHRFYSDDDNDFWFDVFMNTPEYHKIDSINGGDWEDFYYYTTPKLGTEDATEEIPILRKEGN